MVILRDMIESDIEDYVRWFTDPSEENDWDKWDAPWEQEETTAEAERAAWTAYYQSLKALPPDAPRWKFEIEADGVHIGWVSAYDDLGYLENRENIPAIGIDIPSRSYRGRGNGKAALALFMEYLKKQGHTRLYMQTWSGNIPVVRLADRLGFREYARVKELREVNGRKYDAITFIVDL